MSSENPADPPLKLMPDGFYHRGADVTRLEAFVDASFAFALSLLAIAGNAMPQSTQDLLNSLKTVPAYAASFLLLIQFWRSHASWSRRYGLDDAASQRLSLLLIFLVLIFVYPMNMVFGSLFSLLSNGYLPLRFAIRDSDSFRDLFVTFGVAFFSMGAVMALLYRHALTCAPELALNSRELALTRLACWRWSLVPIVAGCSIALALFIPQSLNETLWIGMPGFIYFFLNLAGFYFAYREKLLLLRSV
jgi:uncharacterized membrane protein